MLPELDPTEARVIGCLIEKSVLTPDQYPLTLNAITTACNQKSGRDPVLNLKPGEVEHALKALMGRHLVVSNEQMRSRTDRYAQRLCNSRYSHLQFDPPELAVVCLLLLRGAQTPGELRARSGRLHVFADNAEVLATLERLATREPYPLVVQLPRRPGRKDAEWMHLLSGPIDPGTFQSVASDRGDEDGRERTRVSTAELLARIEALEAEVASLRERLPPPEDNDSID